MHLNKPRTSLTSGLTSSLRFTCMSCLQFLGELHVLFNARRKDLLEARLRRRAQGSLSLTPLASPGAVAAADVHHLSAQSSFSANPAMQLNFLPETASVRKDPSWRVASIPADLQDRHVEITGPVDRKMVINALNSGAQVFMADFEDSHAPTWEGTIAGQYNLKYAVRGTLSLTVPASTNAGAGSATAAKAKTYELNKTGRLATLMVRPRGWHLHENHVLFDGEPASASLCDFGLYFYHNAAALVAKGSGPYFYLPKMESYLEARLWNDVFAYAQQRLGIPYGTVRATCLIETLPAVVQIEEILYELRHHSAGLNCGRWDYIFSAIKTLGRNTNTSNSSATSRSSGVNANGVSLAEAQALGAFVLPDRQAVTMTVPWMAAYVQQLVATCHRRGAHAMGGMSAQIPIKGDDAANAAAMDRVRADKLREVTAGHDGTWVAHPALIPVAKEVFNRHMKTANQIPEEALSARSRAEGTAQDHYYGAAPVVASKPGGAIFVPDGYFNTGNTSTNASNVSGFVKSYHDVTATCSDGNNHSASAHSASAYDLFAVSTSAHALSNSTGNVNNNSNLGAAGIFGVTGHPHSTSGQSTSSHATNAGGVACAGVWGAGSAAAAHSHHDRIGSNNVIGVDYNNTNSGTCALQEHY